MEEDVKKEFVEIVQANQGIINSICRIYSVTQEDQKDARQEIILQLWKSFSSFKGDAKISTWIYKVALNTVLKQKRKLDNKPIEIEPQRVAVANLLVEANLDDDFQQLQQLISLLQAEEKALVILHLEGYNHKEIGHTLNISPTNVSTRLNRIRTKLKSLYKKYTHESK